MKKETLISISERTGVSISTVSRVLNGKAEKYRISRKTIDKVTQEAKECNYTPNFAAQSLRTNKTGTIGLIIPGIDNQFFSNIANVIIREARLNKYTVILVDTMEDADNEIRGINSLVSRNIDGMIVVPSGTDPKQLENINAQFAPIVLIDRYFKSTNLSYVSTDNYIGSFNAVEMLIQNGHKHILCIRGKQNSITTMERVRGYKAALAKYGLEANAMIHGEDFSTQNGYIETKLALNSQNRPTAIFAMSNTIMLGAIKALTENGYRVPDDISVIAFDNNTYLDFFTPAISCISQPIEEIGMISVKLLLQLISHQKTDVSQILLPPHIISRASVKSIK